MIEKEQSSSESQKSQKVTEYLSISTKACINNVEPIKQTLIN